MSDIQSDDKVELVMVNADRSKQEALAWAKQHNFAFPMVMMSKLGRSHELKKFFGGAFPTYVLIDKDGTVLAKGVRSCKAKIKTL